MFELNGCGAIPLVHVLADQCEGFAFARSGGLFDGAGEGLQLNTQVGFGDQMETGREDRRFKDRMSSAMKADEVAHVPAVDDLRL